LLAILASVVVISLSGVMMPGPMFTMTVAKSYRTPWAGTQVSLGHAVIEVPLILLIYFGFGTFFENTVLRVVLSLLGGGMIIRLGVSMLRARAVAADSSKDTRHSAFVSGIVLSGLNPFFLFWWATVGLLLVVSIRDFGAPGLIALIVTHWMCDFVWLSFVSVLIYRTQQLWGRRLQEGIFIVCGVLLLGFGGWYLLSGVRLAF
jgi:threonine/homoserine/homoserine lactone efflux protein